MATNFENHNADEFPTPQMERSYSTPRTAIGLALTVLAFLLLGVALLPLFLVIGFVIVKGANRLNLELFTGSIPVALQEGGGIAPAILGTLIVVGIATAISIPFGVLAAVYLSEFSSGRIARWIRFATNVLSGVPSIIVGIFAYGVIVLTTNTYSAVAGGFALAILMLPIVVRTADESLQLVPQEVRWASVGVGASNFQTVLTIVLPAAMGAIATGVTLAIARAAGETAPLIFTALFSQYWPRGIWEPVPTLSVLIYNFAAVPYQNQQEIAWAASLILVLLILLASILARWVASKSTY
ncbi:MAG: Phosphate transport system permease protein PstA [Chroococcidiopsis sp. SAG 2025]|uniref:phosphate ABC transporter permease PstA n=1 Tax=Chroococcidiopsis sp. SAG 2025 TaxID=171389 RepID=UPI002936E667|nr:phosphate ABC transporter permease PstA [Chroococcidiopsis sp. SAG 2025]MDV2994615.1 Phosphate transport system permease protein PstA [Chroococcidiopsis sp. SAG 2025]